MATLVMEYEKTASHGPGILIQERRGPEHFCFSSGIWLGPRELSAGHLSSGYTVTEPGWYLTLEDYLLSDQHPELRRCRTVADCCRVLADTEGLVSCRLNGRELMPDFQKGVN